MKDVVRSVVGVNAQRTSAMMLSLRARVAGLTQEDIEKAIGHCGDLARTWSMRGTIHLSAAGDLQWLIPLLGPVFIAKSKRRRDELGLSQEVLSRGLEGIRNALAGGEPMTRWELIDELSEGGIDLDRGTQAPFHLIRHAGLEGLVCMGPDRDNGESTYALFDEWIGEREELPQDTGLARLALRYLQGYGPASIKDFTAWSGLPAKEARRAMDLAGEAEELIEVDAGGQDMWLPEEKRKVLDGLDGEGVVKLLPAFDSYLLGYKDRELIVPGSYRKEVYRGGQTAPVVLVDGAAAGVWRHEPHGRRLVINVLPFGALGDEVLGSVSEEAEDVARFLGFSDLDLEGIWSY